VQGRFDEAVQAFGEVIAKDLPRQEAAHREHA